MNFIGAINNHPAFVLVLVAIATPALLIGARLTSGDSPREGISDAPFVITPVEAYDALSCEEDDDIVITLDDRDLPIAICMHIEELHQP